MHKIISVYFSGTGFQIADTNFLTANLYHGTEESDSQISMGFNGCGVDYGFGGVIFGSGLDEQCDKVITRILEEMRAGHHITLNVYGHSRGGVAALLLAKQLGALDPEKLDINLAMLDPVPGNYISTTSLDAHNATLANKTMDLSDCKPLKKVLVLYPYEPLPDIFCHAPLVAIYPEKTEVDIEVLTGCHAEAENIEQRASELPRYRIIEFLVKNGTDIRGFCFDDIKHMKDAYLFIYKRELAKVTSATSRATHSTTDMVITAQPGAKYLNSHHRKLAGGTDDEPVALSMQPDTGFSAKVKQFFTKNPWVGHLIAWVLIALAVTAIIYFTGGLAAISFLTAAVAKLSVGSIFVFAPIVGSVLAALWYATKPLLSWCAAKIHYPYFAMRTLETPEEDLKGSSDTIIANALGSSGTETMGSEPYHGTSSLFTQPVARNQDDHVTTSVLAPN